MDKVDAYLNRIGYTGERVADYNTLQALQRLHLQAVPYENLDIMAGIPLSLEIDHIYEKIVTRHRGGYCFELNTLFEWLLKSLGFKVESYFARFLLDEPTIPMRRHQILVVEIEEKRFITDVGVGLVIPLEPIALVPGTTTSQGNEMYRLEWDDFLGYTLYRLKDQAFRVLYAFTTEPQLPVDFVAASFYCEKHPESVFNKMDMVHIFTPEGRKSIAGNEFRIYTQDGVTAVAIGGERENILQTHFGIQI